MRINDHIVVQLIDAADSADDRLVFMDDSTGEEIVIARCDWPRLEHALTYLIHLTGEPGPEYAMWTSQPAQP